MACRLTGRRFQDQAGKRPSARSGPRGVGDGERSGAYQQPGLCGCPFAWQRLPLEGHPEHGPSSPPRDFLQESPPVPCREHSPALGAGFALGHLEWPVV
jgi:hypothetical protein